MTSSNHKSTETLAKKIQFAVIGGGVIGGGWVARFLLMGSDVKIFDPDPEAPRKIDEVLSNARRSLPALYEHALPPEGSLSFVNSMVFKFQSNLIT